MENLSFYDVLLSALAGIFLFALAGLLDELGITNIYPTIDEFVGRYIELPQHETPEAVNEANISCDSITRDIHWNDVQIETKNNNYEKEN